MLISFICFAFITSPVPTWVMIFINFILIIREFLLIKFQKSEYFLDLWNLIDFALIMGIFFYGIVDLTEMQIWFIFKKEAVIIIMGALWLRFLFYLTVVRRIRYLVIMIIEVIWDISGFLILLGYSILAFTFLFLMV